MSENCFEARNTLVVGGAIGMGRACVGQLARAGARGHVIDTDAEGAAALTDALTQEGHPVSGAVADVMDEAAFTAAFDSGLEDFSGRFDIVIHIAGVSRGGLLRDQTTADWEWHYRVNLRSHVISAKRASAAMTPRGAGAIVLMSKLSGLRGDPGRAGCNAPRR